MFVMFKFRKIDLSPEKLESLHIMRENAFAQSAVGNLFFECKLLTQENKSGA